MSERAARGFDRGAFYRAARWLHAYLSAFAFLALIFFSLTGLLLDHPDWLQGRKPPEREATVRLAPSELAAARQAKEPGRAYAAAIGRHARLLGAFRSGDVEEGSALIHMEGAKGVADIDLDTRTGVAKVTLAPANMTTVIEELHRGRYAGGAWKWVIDLSAGLILALSAVGYVLFFSLRFRLRTSLALTAASLVVLVGVYLLFVP